MAFRSLTVPGHGAVVSDGVFPFLCSVPAVRWMGLWTQIREACYPDPYKTP
jgi:hypothetical protein